MPQVDYAKLAAQHGGKAISGMIPGNVDLFKQPKVKNPDGTTSTVDSRSFNFDGKEVLLPSVTPDGRHLRTDDEIISEYQKTGRHLGMFSDVASANRYASQLHDDYAAGRYDKPKGPIDYAALAQEVMAQPAPVPAEPSRLEQAAGMVGDVAIGAAKGVGQTVTNLGGLLHKIPGVSAGVNALYGAPVSAPAFAEANRVLTPTNTAQRIGKGAEQLAEVVLPGRAITTAATGAATRLAPKIAPVIGARVAQIAPRAAVEAASGAGLAVAQGGDPRIGAVTGLIPAVGGTNRAMATSLREQADKKVVQALGPTKERFKAIAEKRAREILNRGVTGVMGKSRATFQKKAAAAVEDLGEQIDDAIQQYGNRTVSTAPIVDALETSKAAFQTTRTMPLTVAQKNGLLGKPGVRVIEDAVKTAAPAVERRAATGGPLPPGVSERRMAELLGKFGGSQAATADQASAFAASSKKVKVALGGRQVQATLRVAARPVAQARVEVPVTIDARPIKQIEKLQTTLRELGDDARVDQLVAVRRAWDKVVAQAGGYAQRGPGAIGIPLKEQTEAWAKREGTDAIRELLKKEVPELAAINKEFSFWKDIDDVLTQTLKRTQPQGPGLGRQVAEAAGAAAGSSAGLGPAILTAKAARLAQTVFTSPRWRLVDAKLRDGLADAITSGSAARVTSALTRIAAVQGSKAAASP